MKIHYANVFMAGVCAGWAIDCAIDGRFGFVIGYIAVSCLNIWIARFVRELAP